VTLQTHLVTLEPWEYTHAASVGAARFAANWGKQDAAHYDKSRMEDARTAQFAACVAELAVAKHTNRFWSGHVWHASEHRKYRDVADVGHNIEVRRVRTPNRNPAVRRHQVGKGLVLWAAYPVAPEFRTVEIWGWLPYDEAWELGTPSQYDPQNTRTVARGLLHNDPPRIAGLRAA
jgi:hypothetical protein